MLKDSPRAQADLENLLVKKIDPAKVKTLASHLADLKGLEKFPQLTGFLTDPVLEGATGKEPRDGGSIYLQARGGMLLATLKEPSQQMMMKLEVKNLACLWAELEAALGDAGSMWEVDPWATKRLKGKKK